MDFLEQKLFDFISSKSNTDLEEIKRELETDKEEMHLFQKCLDSLEAKGKIYKGKSGYYSILSTQSGINSGTITTGTDKKIYVKTNDGYKISISKNDSIGLLPGDIVLISGITEEKNVLVGKIKKILKRKHEQISCEVINENGENKLVTYNGKIKRYIRINKEELNKHGVGEILLVRLFTYVNNLCDAEFVKTIGHISEPDVDEKSIAYDHGFETEFSLAAIKELQKIPTYVDVEKHLKLGRNDLRAKTMFTIDGSDTKDIDDSIGIEILPNGNYKLYVSIADVGYYIKDDSALFKEAFERGTSVYMNDTVIPMLPPKISNGICSLHPYVDRLTKTCEMIIDKDGKVVDYQIYDSIINSKKKMTYENVNKILVDGEKLIENFMLLVNETVAQHIFYRGLPFIYRIHESPSEDAVKDFLETLNTLGFKFKNCKEITSNKFIQSITEMLQESDENSEVLSELLLINTMKKAKYSSINIGHFGLALKHYTHFTSPIRRFADLQVHKLLNLYKNFSNADYSELEKYLYNVAKQCSNRSNEADKVEREAGEMRVAEYLSYNIGSKHTGTVTYITQSYLKVKTEEGFSGEISISDLQDDNFKYNSKNNSVIGSNSGIIYKIGTPIEITIKDASKKSRMVKFTDGKSIRKQKSNVKTKKRS